MVTLKIHFNDASQVEPCLKAMREATEVGFKVNPNVKGASMRDVMTKPEALDVEAARVLEFDSDEDCRQFQMDCHEVYQRFAS